MNHPLYQLSSNQSINCSSVDGGGGGGGGGGGDERTQYIGASFAFTSYIAMATATPGPNGLMGTRFSIFIHFLVSFSMTFFFTIKSLLKVSFNSKNCKKTKHTDYFKHILIQVLERYIEEKTRTKE